MGSTMRPTFSRRAASAFSLMPPTRRTLPVSVNSPVIARSRFTGRSNARLSKAEVMVTPADGPSFGVAPSGMFMCMVASSRNSLSSSTSLRNSFAYVRAMLLDSLMTLPNLPVTFSRLEPCERRRGPETGASLPPLAATESDLLVPAVLSTGRQPRASTKSVLPPRAVQARPITTPGGIPSGKRWSEVKGGWPTNFRRFCREMMVCLRSSSTVRTRLNATLRAMRSSNCRSSRTPASRA
mmetsp:Transcript_50056/g.116199  ORF Transcript_50056/g.116199 Transcript_50056/m.116199 type:complete len:239 (-) Transcript_50056:1906-2622(-)